MKSKLYSRGLPPQPDQATNADAGMTANSASTKPAWRCPPPGRSRRTYLSAPTNVTAIATGFHRPMYEAGIESPVTSCTTPLMRNPGWRKTRSPGARSNGLPMRTWWAASRIHAKYWS